MPKINKTTKRMRRTVGGKESDQDEKAEQMVEKQQEEYEREESENYMMGPRDKR